MTLKEQFQAQLESEGPKTLRAVENVPEGRDDWKPHEKSMPLGRLAMLVAGMPGWVSFIVDDDELELQPADRPATPPPALRTRAERVKSYEEAMAKARASLARTNDEHLMKPWKLLVGGKVVSEAPRHVVLRDTFAHLAHHRGQLTVYLRLNDAPVPAIYGPSADDARFA